MDPARPRFISTFFPSFSLLFLLSFQGIAPTFATDAPDPWGLPPGAPVPAPAPAPAPGNPGGGAPVPAPQPAPIPPPPVPGPVTGPGIPHAPKKFGCKVVEELSEKLKEIEKEPFRRQPLFGPLVPAFVKQQVRKNEERFTGLLRQLFDREWPVWVLDDTLPFDAPFVAKTEFGTLDPQDLAMADVTLAKARIDHLIQSALDYPKVIRGMRDGRAQAEIRIEQLEKKIAEYERKQKNGETIDKYEADLVVISNGKVDDRPFHFEYPGLWKMRNELSGLKDMLKELHGGFGKLGSFVNVDKSQVINLKLIEALREMFRREWQIAQRQKKPMSQYMADKFAQIEILLPKGAPGKEFSPPKEAWDHIRRKELTAEELGTFTTFSGKFKEKRVIGALKKKNQELGATAASTSETDKSDLLTRWGWKTRKPEPTPPPGTQTGSEPSTTFSDTGSQKIPYDIARISEWFNNLSPEDRAASGLGRISSYVALVSSGTGIVTVGSGLAALAYNAVNSNTGVNILDIGKVAWDWYKDTDENRMKACASKTDPEYSGAYGVACGDTYIKTTFLKDYIKEMGLSDTPLTDHAKAFFDLIPFVHGKGIYAHESNLEVRLWVDNIDTEKTSRAAYRDPKTGYIYLRRALSPAGFADQPGAVLDPKYAIIRIDPKSLPEKTDDHLHPIERSADGKQIFIRTADLMRTNGSLYSYGKDGKLAFNSKIEEEIRRMNDLHELYMQKSIEEANVSLELSTRFSSSDPCGANGDVTTTPWIKGSDDQFREGFNKCVVNRYQPQLRFPGIKLAVQNALVTPTDHKRKAIDSLVHINKNFGNFICNIFQNREKVLGDLAAAAAASNPTPAPAPTPTATSSPNPFPPEPAGNVANFNCEQALDPRTLAGGISYGTGFGIPPYGTGGTTTGANVPGTNPGGGWTVPTMTGTVPGGYTGTWTIPAVPGGWMMGGVQGRYYIDGSGQVAAQTPSGAVVPVNVGNMIRTSGVWAPPAPPARVLQNVQNPPFFSERE